MAREEAGEVQVTLPMEKLVNAIPMVGWHDPYGTFELDGKTWKIAIAGGCKALVITKPGDRGASYSVDLGQVAYAMVEVIKARGK